MKIKTFVFNPFRVNTYLLYDDTRECVIVDAACYENSEVKEILDFIASEKLVPRALLSTHGHVDHVCGNIFILKYFDVPLLMNEKDLFFIDTAVEYGRMFGFEIIQPSSPTGFLEDGSFSFGSSKFEIMSAPGHSPGSVMFHSPNDNFIISGDVLFADSIGRTDLEGGDYNTLMQTIKSKLLVLPPVTLVYPGHGHFTDIGTENENNPFIRESY